MNPVETHKNSEKTSRAIRQQHTYIAFDISMLSPYIPKYGVPLYPNSLVVTAVRH